MKENVKVFLIALVLGMMVAFFVCYKLDSNIFVKALENQVTIFNFGSYSKIEDAEEKQKKYPFTVIYQDKNIYKVVGGVYQEEETISLMESYFLEKGYVFKKEMIKTESSFLKDIRNYELLIESSERNYYESINQSILNKFHEMIVLGNTN